MNQGNLNIVRQVVTEDFITCINETGYVHKIKRGKHYVKIDPKTKLCRWLRCPKYPTPDGFAKNQMKEYHLSPNKTVLREKQECNHAFYFTDKLLLRRMPDYEEPRLLFLRDNKSTVIGTEFTSKRDYDQETATRMVRLRA